jgi:Na+/proline symporter
MPDMSDRAFLRTMRITIVVFACCVLAYALNSALSIFHMVESAYKITLAGAFVPLFFGAFWKKASTQGALAAVFGGIGSWILVEVLIGEAALVPPQLIGLVVSILGMVIGSLLPQWVGKLPPQVDLQAEMFHHAHHAQHHAAAETHHVASRPHHH